MKSFPHTTPWGAAMGFAAIAATAVTLSVAVILPASVGLRPAEMAMVAASDAAPVEVSINPGRIEVTGVRSTVASRESFGHLVATFLVRKSG